MAADRTLHDLVPAFYRRRDADPAGGGGLLTALLDVLALGSRDVQSELLRELDDRFVETCSDEELVHFAALLGLRELPGRRSRRALVAGVLGYRRRKGTIAALEDLARAATGWTAKATEYFPLLTTTCNVNHTRPDYQAVPSLRDPLVARRMGSVFDVSAHTPDVRGIATRGGRYNLPNVAVDLWRLEPVLELRRPLVPAGGDRFRISPLSADVPLWSRGDPEPFVEHRVGMGDTTEPLTVLEAVAGWDRLYGDGASVTVYVAGVPLDRSEVTVCDLRDSATGWGGIQPPTTVGIDPERGRLVLTAPPGGPVTVTSHRALPLPVGGGGYARAAATPQPGTVTVTVAADGNADAPDLAAALARFSADHRSREVRILDSSRYSLAAPLQVPAHTRLRVIADDGEWPVLESGLTVDGAAGSQVLLDGLLILGGPLTIVGSPAAVRLAHCTVVPGHSLAPDLAPVAADQPSVMIDVDDTADTEVVLDSCVTGPIRGDAEQVRVRAVDTVLASSSTPTPDVLDVTVLVGGPVAAFPVLPAEPTLRASFGPATRLDLVLPAVPASLAEAAAALESALRIGLRGGLDGDGTATDASADVSHSVAVRAAGSRLYVVGTDLLPISFSPAGDGVDGTGDALGLTSVAFRAVARVSAPLTNPAACQGQSGALPVTVWEGGSATGTGTATVPALPGTLDAIAMTLAAAVQAGPDAAATVLALDDRLAIVPGAANRSLQPAASPLAELLGVRRALPVISGSGDGLSSGPALHADRVTVLGVALVRSAELSDAIVNGRLVAARQQTGCLRYSWIGAGSRSPRRFRSRSGPADPAPTFASTVFGTAAFAQLTPTCPAAVAEGAEDGAEMGAFSRVGQPQRLAAAQSLLGEYLRFSSEAGIFLAS